MITTILSIIIALLTVPFLWNFFYNRYIKKVKADYNKDILDLDGISLQSPPVERILKLYWMRQQTYEFSGYAILLLAMLFLLACIVIFIFSTEIITASGIALTNKDFWIFLISLRIGIALVVFFICQILLKLYRYCVKFAIFYLGLFDSLFIYKDIGKDLKETIELFMPNTDIGDSPQSPANEIIKLLANVEKAKSATV
jgi:hypothetical protein